MLLLFLSGCTKLAKLVNSLHIDLRCTACVEGRAHGSHSVEQLISSWQRHMRSYVRRRDGQKNIVYVTSNLFLYHI